MKVVNLQRAKIKRAREKQKQMIAGLEYLLARVKAGEISGFCFAGIPTSREAVTIAALHNDDCGFHEVVGAASLLSDYVLSVARVTVEPE
jgi:hypothetical protein